MTGVNCKLSRGWIRGHRIETPEEELNSEVHWYHAVAKQNWKLILLIAAAGVLILAIITALLLRWWKKKKYRSNKTL